MVFSARTGKLSETTMVLNSIQPPEHKQWNGVLWRDYFFVNVVMTKGLINSSSGENRLVRRGAGFKATLPSTSCQNPGWDNAGTGLFLQLQPVANLQGYLASIWKPALRPNESPMCSMTHNFPPGLRKR